MAGSFARAARIPVLLPPPPGPAREQAAAMASGCCPAGRLQPARVRRVAGVMRESPGFPPFGVKPVTGG